MEELLGLERKLRTEGFLFIGGVDEAGRGPLAGPVVAACVMFPEWEHLPPVDDSKKLTASQRERLADEIRMVPGARWALGTVEVADIDRMNILQATYLAMRRAVGQIPGLEFIIVDGNPVPDLPKPSLAVVKGDGKSASVAAASILAKVHRDALMMELDAAYPQYGFAVHKGYGTRRHLEALEKYGASPAHRRSFGPVKRVIGREPEQPDFWEDQSTVLR